MVAGILVDGGKVFAARRGPGGECAGLWEFPGGKVEPGETHRQALERELAEELDIQARAGDFLVTVTHAYTTFHLTMHCYLCTRKAGTIRLHEHAEGRWLAPEELREPAWAPADVPVVAALEASPVLR